MTGETPDDLVEYEAIKRRHTRPPSENEGPRFRLIKFADVKPDTRRRYLIKGLIPRDGLIVVWGPPKCGKSFLVSDLALHIALGREYRGRRVEHGLVIYITCEGQSGFPARIEAFRRTKLNGASEPLFRLLSTRLDLINDVEDLIADIAADLGEEEPVLIVVDTLNRSLVGSESKDEDMSDYVRACDRLREHFSCAVAIVHHCGVEATRPRGHTSLTGAADAQVAVKRDQADRILATVEYMKDGPEGGQIVSTLKIVDVGIDEDGEPLTSCVVEDAGLGSRSAIKPAKKLPVQLKNCLADHVTDVPTSKHVKPGTRGVPIELWRRYLESANLINKDGNPREQFRRMNVTLQDGGYIGVREGFVWINA
jgi:AAA domain